MNKKAILIVLFLALVFTSVLSATQWNVTNRNDNSTYWCKGGKASDYLESITMALNSASDGDTIIVCKTDRPYHEGSIVINKSLNIYGNESGVVIIYSAFYISANYVNISNFTFNNSEEDTSTGMKAAIFLDANNSIIANNNFANSERAAGIVINGTGNIIFNNTFQNVSPWDIFINPAATEALCNNNITENRGEGNRPIGFYNESVNISDEVFAELILCNADNSNVVNVTIIGSATAYNNGLLMLWTDNSNITKLNSSNNAYGIFLNGGSGNNISNNRLQENILYDLFILPSPTPQCDNIIENNNGSGGGKIGFYNESVNISDEVFAELILCNADNSNIVHVTVDGSNTLDNNGLLILHSNNIVINSSTLNNDLIGLFFDGFSDNLTVQSTTMNSNKFGFIGGNFMLWDAASPPDMIVLDPNAVAHITLLSSEANNNFVGAASIGNHTFFLDGFSANNNIMFGFAALGMAVRVDAYNITATNNGAIGFGCGILPSGEGELPITLGSTVFNLYNATIKNNGYGINTTDSSVGAGFFAIAHENNITIDSSDISNNNVTGLYVLGLANNVIVEKTKMDNNKLVGASLGNIMFTNNNISFDFNITLGDLTLRAFNITLPAYINNLSFNASNNVIINSSTARGNLLAGVLMAGENNTANVLSSEFSNSPSFGFVMLGWHNNATMNSTIISNNSFAGLMMSGVSPPSGGLNESENYLEISGCSKLTNNGFAIYMGRFGDGYEDQRANNTFYGTTLNISNNIFGIYADGGPYQIINLSYSTLKDNVFGFWAGGNDLMNNVSMYSVRAYNNIIGMLFGPSLFAGNLMDVNITNNVVVDHSSSSDNRNVWSSETKGICKNYPYGSICDYHNTTLSNLSFGFIVVGVNNTAVFNSVNASNSKMAGVYIGAMKGNFSLNDDILINSSAFNNNSVGLIIGNKVGVPPDLNANPGTPESYVQSLNLSIFNTTLHYNDYGLVTFSLNNTILIDYSSFSHSKLVGAVLFASGTSNATISNSVFGDNGASAQLDPAGGLGIVAYNYTNISNSYFFSNKMDSIFVVGEEFGVLEGTLLLENVSYSGTHIWLSDVMRNESYLINSSIASDHPPGLISFRNKSIYIINMSPNFSIDNIYFGWTDEEATSYDESTIALYRYNESNLWEEVQFDLNETDNYLNISNVNRPGRYALFASNTTWPLSTASGDVYPTVFSSHVVPTPEGDSSCYELRSEEAPPQRITVTKTENELLTVIISESCDPFAWQEKKENGILKIKVLYKDSPLGDAIITLSKSRSPLPGIGAAMEVPSDLQITQGRLSQTKITDQNGVALFDNLANGDYAITISDDFGTFSLTTSISCEKCPIPTSCVANAIWDEENCEWVCKEGYKMDEAGNCIAKEITPQPQCVSNEDCAFDKYCDNGTCKNITIGECGYISEHKWIEYECCADKDCKSPLLKCLNNKCVMKKYTIDMPQNATVGETITIKVTEDGKAMPNAPILVKLPTGAPKTLIADSAGQAKLFIDYEGGYVAALVDEEGSVLTSALLQSFPKGVISPEIGKPPALLEQEGTKTLVSVVAGAIIGVALTYWYLRRK